MVPECRGLAAPGVAGGIEDLHAVLVEDGAALLISEVKMIVHGLGSTYNNHNFFISSSALQDCNCKSGNYAQ